MRTLIIPKPLANSNRWRDDAAPGYDLIDPAMTVPPKNLICDAMAKAACCDSVTADLPQAIEELRAGPLWLGRYLQALAMTTASKAVLWSRIRALAP
ncbi:MAG: hypothetical protein K1X74_23420 [Pirellulales bacterium]|nr:hypothetical protein [Pirellulales bacterium]